MTPQKKEELGGPQLDLGGRKDRKPWVKKTPVEVVLNQIERLKENLTAKEEELNETRRQLKKLEEVRKLLEAK